MPQHTLFFSEISVNQCQSVVKSPSAILSAVLYRVAMMWML